MQKRTFTYFLAVASCLFSWKAFAQDNENYRIFEDTISYDYSPIPSFSDDDLRQRLSTMKCTVKPIFTPVVRSYIKTYTMNRRDKAQDILARAQMYFPIFERKLQSGGVPSDIKYLAVVESALNPTALSRAGAKGLWQFMPSTGKMYGLNQDSYVDERCDPNKSTDAAVEFLSKLYDTYGDWALALAAYNSGPGRVNYAIKRGRSRNFWSIQNYLPRETRNYVPAFIAACYLMNYYHLHDLKPVAVMRDMQYTETMKIYDGATFTEISDITGTPYHIVEALNPSYKRQYIPASYSGNYLILPFDKIGAFAQYKGITDAPTPNFSSGSLNVQNNNPKNKITYLVQANDNLTSIAFKFGCKVDDLKSWNGLFSENILPGQLLAIFNTKPAQTAKPSAPKEKERTRPTALMPLPNIAKPIGILPRKDLFIATERVQEQTTGGNGDDDAHNFLEVLDYTMKRGESLLDVAQEHGISLETILLLNPNLVEADLQAGRIVKIPLN